MAGLPEPWRLPAHMLFKLLGFAAAFLLLRRERARGGDPATRRWRGPAHGDDADDHDRRGLIVTSGSAALIASSL